jgi:hypothetical protein
MQDPDSIWEASDAHLQILHAPSVPTKPGGEKAKNPEIK